MTLTVDHTDVARRLDAKRSELAAVLAEAGPDLDLGRVKSVPGSREDVLGWIRAKNSELDTIGASMVHLRSQAAASPRPSAGPTLGTRFVASKAYRGRTVNGEHKAGPEADLANVDVKTLMTTSAFAPDPSRSPGVTPSAQRATSIVDLIPVTETTSTAVKFMEETTFTNNAAEAAEGGTFGEAAFVLTEQTSNVRKIPVFLPITDEQLEDEPQARDLVDTRLGYMIRLRMDGQAVAGNGTAPNLRGFLNVVGTQTQAKGADTALDAAYKALVKVRVTGRAVPSGWGFHPTDWQGIRLLKDSAGAYIFGPPSSPGPAFLWGAPVTESDAFTAGTALAGDFAGYSSLSFRRALTIQVSNSHGTYFVEGKSAIRADVRVALVVYRPAAFCTLTGL